MFGTTKISKLLKRKNKTLGIFTKTVKDLVQLNSEIDSETKIKAKKMDALAGELRVLDSIKRDNDETIGNINSIILPKSK